MFGKKPASQPQPQPLHQTITLQVDGQALAKAAVNDAAREFGATTPGYGVTAETTKDRDKRAAQRQHDEHNAIVDSFHEAKRIAISCRVVLDAAKRMDRMAQENLAKRTERLAEIR